LEVAKRPGALVDVADFRGRPVVLRGKLFYGASSP